MDLIFKTGLTMIGLGIMILFFTLCISIFFSGKYDKYNIKVGICGGFLYFGGIALLVFNLIIHLWRI